ncbi:hypothetical protein [Siphonobacter sp. SORGH_AS_1065]|uniref:DUF6924 domain-containing protein n=1 Tax=Siphonobacter sp. SORGH_AS_1065 TaxID=3041795 RepID=UPI002788DE76|nr:hypothetical protein [Siphonobacter sp. SORGH_AS_1065]MDQ1086993.1 hypothetical protein [Siphonobacter sp. SORGH_AS_1065]
MATIPETEFPLILRTDFSNNDLVNMLYEEALKGNQEDEYTPYVEVLNDQSFEGFTPQDLLKLIPKDYAHDFMFILDSLTIQHPEHPFICLSLSEFTFGETLRFIPKELYILESNLFTANMLFEEFIDKTDIDGIFRATGWYS